MAAGQTKEDEGNFNYDAAALLAKSTGGGRNLDGGGGGVSCVAPRHARHTASHHRHPHGLSCPKVDILHMLQSLRASGVLKERKDRYELPRHSLQAKQGNFRCWMR